MRTVPFVHDLLVVLTLELAGALFDRALDGVLGHVHLARLGDREPQAGVHLWVSPTPTRGHDDLPGHFSERLATLGVLAALRILILAHFEWPAIVHTSLE